MISVETLEKNWKKFDKLCRRLSDEGLNNLLDALGDRIVMCPASPREDGYGCYPGGMVEHSLDVTARMRTLNDAMDLGLHPMQILKVGLLHEIGKVGDLDKPYFVDQDSDWHRDKLGQLYKFNEDLNKMSLSHRVLYLLQHFGVTLSAEEWLAIQLSRGSHFEENRFYVGHEGTLGLLLQQAKAMSIHMSR